MAYPVSIPQRTLNTTAFRVRDELGKGREVLRQYGPIRIPATATAIRKIVAIPLVDIKIVDVKVVGEGAANVTLDLLSSAAYDTAAGAGNRLITPITSFTDDRVQHAALTSLAGRVRAGQPIVAVLTDTGAQAGTVEVVIDYIFADEKQVSYTAYGSNTQTTDPSGFPGAVRKFNRYHTAKTLSDEIGKGQEVLRQFTVSQAAIPTGATTEFLIGIQSVDIKVVEVKILGEGAADATIDVLAPAATDTAPAAGNRLISAADQDDAADDVVFLGTLTSNASRVKANQPIVASVTGGASGAGVLSFVVSYVLADMNDLERQDKHLTYADYGATVDKPAAGNETFSTSAQTVRRLHTSASRITDEVGKGQEVLRQFNAVNLTAADAGGDVRALVGVPDVPIQIVDVALIGEGAAAINVDLITAPAWDTAVASATPLITQVTEAGIPDDKVVHAALTSAAKSVAAGQPIIFVVTDDGTAAGTVAVVVSYILADAAVTYHGKD